MGSYWRLAAELAMYESVRSSNSRSLAIVIMLPGNYSII